MNLKPWIVSGMLMSVSLPHPAGAGNGSAPNPPEISQAEIRETLLSGSLFRRRAKELSPAVVNVRSLKKITRYYGDFHLGMPGVPANPFNGKFEKRGEGSGFIIEKNGTILTTTHIVAESDILQVTLSTGQMYRGQLLGMDPVTDIAVVKIDAPQELPVIPLGDSDQIQPGDWVMAIGSPFGLDLTVTLGIVSAKGRSLGRSPYDDFIQIDASINPGNSGGPLIDTLGNAVGVNAAILQQGQGLGFSVPINIVKNFLPQMKKRGRVVRSWLGVLVRNFSLPEKEALKLDSHRGALISRVAPGSPAEKAGLQNNDIILLFNNKPVKSSHELPKRIAQTAAGEKIPVRIFRNGQTQTLEAVLEEIPPEGLQ